MNIIYHLEKNAIPFYVGKTAKPNNRLNAHKKRFGNDIEMIILEECDDDWRESEQYWINYYKLSGYDLKNTCKGGNGRDIYPKNAKVIIDNLTKWLNKQNIGYKFESTVHPSFLEPLQKYYDSFESKSEGYIKAYNKCFDIFLNNFSSLTKPGDLTQ